MRRDLPSPLQIDAADCDEGNAGGARRDIGLCQLLKTDRRLRALFRRSAEHWPKRHIVRPFGERCGKLRQVVRRDANQQAGRDQTHYGQWQIILTNVHTVALSEHRQIGAIVGDQARPGGGT